MIVFLIKSAICLALFYVFYSIFLERQKIHQFNRFFLLAIILFSFAIPNFVVYIESSFTSPINTLSERYINPFQVSDYKVYIIVIYLIITAVFLLRFVRNVRDIIKKINQNVQIKNENAVLVLLNENVLPHTFWNYIFINKEDYNTKKINDELFTHELTHAKEKHTIDVLLVELFQIIFWFNPILILIKKSIRLNHEFIADERVVITYKNTSQYQHILLDITNWNNANILTSNLNYSLTKMRFQMMIKRSSKFSNNVAKISTIPLLILFVFLFSNINVSDEHNTEGSHSYDTNEHHENRNEREGEHKNMEEHNYGEHSD